MTISDTTLSPTAAKHNSPTMGFGVHPQAKYSASSARARINAMPSAGAAFNRYDTPARSIVDIIADPFRWAVATKPRKIAFASIAMLFALILIF